MPSFRSIRVRIAAVGLAALAVWAPSLPAQDATRSTGEAWQIVDPPQSSLVFAVDGSLIGEIGKQFRSSVALASLPKYVSQAFIAVEDKRFYQVGAVDFRGILGALKDDALHGEHRGASTIPEQLAGMMHPDLIDRRDISLSRKARELNAAIAMVDHYPKDRILEAYLNQVDLGHNWFGIEAAARHYFGKPAAQLTIPEAASIAALPKSPPEYDPSRYPDKNRLRRNAILDLMAEQGYITKDEATKGKLTPIKTAANGGVAAPSNYFVDAVKQQADRAGVPVANGGFRIYTTLDPSLQLDAVDALLKGTTAVEARPDYKHPTYAALRAAGKGSTDYLEGAVIVMDPYTGDVRALVGGRNYPQAPFNRAVTGLRQPGSTFKPIVYATAVSEGIPLNTVFVDTAIDVPLPNGDSYRPGEFDNKYLGPMTMREGLVLSRNVIAVQVGQRAGMDSVALMASRLGITTRIDPVPASAIGASAVHPIDLISAYSAFANNGQVVEPRMITRITDVGGRVVLARSASPPRQVLDPRVAFIVRDAMRDVAERGTGVTAREALPRAIPMAGKTGTTNDNKDVWFVGMTPDLVGLVWLGFDKPKTITSVAAGGALAAPIWGQLMARHYGNQGAGDWPAAPDGLAFAELDRTTGQLATVGTPADHQMMEYFLPGTEPAPMRNSPWSVPRWGPIIFP